MAALVGVLLAATLAWPVRASADGAADYIEHLLPRHPPMICRDQTYALCAGASCFVFNDVAYCTCNVRRGKSISSAFSFDGGNVCSVNGDGVDNGYMVSTFSLPKSLLAPYGDKALYKCPRTSFADYAKCDGGICFTSTIGKASPGRNIKLADNQIVCSCPVEHANPIQGLEIIGPYPCQKAFFKQCERMTANSETGSILYDGTSIGSTKTGIRLLYGQVPPLNECQ